MGVWIQESYHQNIPPIYIARASSWWSGSIFYVKLSKIWANDKQVSFKKEVGVMVIDLVFWLTVCLILKMCY